MLAGRFQNVLALHVLCVVVIVGVCVPFCAFSGLSDAYGLWTCICRISPSGGSFLIPRFHRFQLNPFFPIVSWACLRSLPILRLCLLDVS